MSRILTIKFNYSFDTLTVDENKNVNEAAKNCKNCNLCGINREIEPSFLKMSMELCEEKNKVFPAGKCIVIPICKRCNKNYNSKTMRGRIAESCQNFTVINENCLKTWYFKNCSPEVFLKYRVLGVI